jgi:hypothetical protein
MNSEKESPLKGLNIYNTVTGQLFDSKNKGGLFFSSFLYISYFVKLIVNSLFLFYLNTYFISLF